MDQYKPRENGHENLTYKELEHSIYKKFNIPSYIDNEGRPFADKPAITARIISCGGGTSISFHLYDNTEKIELNKRPGLQVKIRIFEDTRELSLLVYNSNSIPTGHPLAENRDRIIEFCKQCSEEWNLSFNNQFYEAGYTQKEAADIINTTFKLTSAEILAQNPNIDENTLYSLATQISFVGITTFEEFKKQGIKFVSKLNATAVEKIKFLRSWSEKLVAEKILPETVK
jgi:hypothetical protein